jgi:predicted nucleic acid-binding protein
MWTIQRLYYTVRGTANSCVVDASVILKWFLPYESEASLAARVKSDIDSSQLIAYIPQLAVIETFNALSLKQPYRSDPGRTMSEVKTLILQGKLTEKRLRRHDFARALQIVSSYQLVFYDACYLALAERLKAKYLTADYRATSKLTSRTDITELRAY